MPSKRSNQLSYVPKKSKITPYIIDILRQKSNGWTLSPELGGTVPVDNELQDHIESQRASDSCGDT